MAFADELAAMQAVIYENLGLPAWWTPSGGEPYPVTLLADQGDKIGVIGGLGKTNLSRNVFRVRVSELAVAAPGLSPKKGDKVQLQSAGSPMLTVVDPPSADDSRRTEWTLVCA
jgi:hypothetical protein